MSNEQESLTIDEAKALRADPNHKHSYEFARLGELTVGMCECRLAVFDPEMMKRVNAVEAFPAHTAAKLFTKLEEIAEAIYTGDLELALKRVGQTPEMAVDLVMYMDALTAEIDDGINDEGDIEEDDHHSCGYKGECALFRILLACPHKAS